MDSLKYNRNAWDKKVEAGNEWTVPVDKVTIEKAAKGEWDILLTPSKPVPREWFPEIKNLDVLCLACGGGQQGPVLAAAGANVTVFDFSANQLKQDRLVAEREGLELSTVQGDMANLEAFPDNSFDLVFFPTANMYVPDVKPVWKEAFRVLRKGGTLLTGIMNPAAYIFDYELANSTGIVKARYSLPYSDVDSLGEDEKQRYMELGEPLEFSHSLEDQLGGQIAAGFVIAGFYEDSYGDSGNHPVAKYMPVFFATRALKQ